MRAWHVLATLGRDAALRDPAELKPLLAPVFARSAEDQKRFYELFDRYVADLKTPLYIPDPPTWRDNLRAFFSKKRVRWGLLAIATACAVLLGYKYYPADKTPVFPEVFFEIKYPPSGHFSPGETMRCVNKTEFLGLDSTEYRFAWQLLRPDGTEVIWNDTSAEFILETPEQDTGAGYAVQLWAQHIPSGKEGAKVFYPSIYCKNRPALPKLSLPSTQIPVGQTVTFALAEKPKPGHRYRWQVIGDTLADAAALRHTFDRPGTFEVQLLVTDTTQPGLCTADTTFTLRVGDEQVSLPYKPLEYDRTPPALVFAWGAYLLLGLLAAAAAWYWWRWLNRKPPQPDAPPSRPASPVQGGRGGADAPPYYIPFREQKGAIRTAREQYRLGDAMRLRQQTDDLVLDLPATLRATLDGGGYPAFRYRHRTRPAEYLFLVDEQLPGHHLARLFRHLAETLRGQDVVLDLVWCDPDLRRFRGGGLPKGLSLDGLRRHFPQHRLVVLGTGHALLDDTDDTAVRLRPDAKPALNAWPQRLLLTPRTAADWDWHEAALYRHFGLYPADLRGLLDAAAFVENGLDTGDMPADFHDWKAQQHALRLPDPRTEARPWRTLADHDAYLKPYGTDLHDWFRALAVHPAPTWEITLAVARALGTAPTHDRLLALARIPALRDGRLHPALRRSMLLALDDDIEQRARRAVLAELNEIRHLTEGSHVAEETAGYMAVQTYLLYPDHPDYPNARTDLAALLHAGMLSRAQEVELDVFVEKQLARPDLNPDLREKMAGEAPKIRYWLEATAPPPQEPPAPPKKPVVTPDFRRAAVLTGLLVLLVGLGWWACRPDSLLNRALLPDDIRPGRDELRHFVFFKEQAPVDSAMIFNNLGALAGELLPRTGTLPATDSLEAAVFSLRKNLYGLRDYNAALRTFSAWLDSAQTPAGMRSAPLEAFEATDAFFEKALNLKPVYTLAAQNAARNRYNYGAALLERYRAVPDSLLRVADLFAATAMLADEALTTLAPDARHGQGVALYYAGLRDSAEALYNTLRTAGYFDTLTLRPNLETLLGYFGICYKVTDVAAAIGFRNRTLSLDELNAIFKEPDGRLARETLLGTIPVGQTVTVLDGSRHFWTVRYKGKTGFVAKSVYNKPTLVPCVPRPDITDATRPTAKPDLRTILAQIQNNMVPVPGGAFRMGCTDEQGEDCSDDEKPAHDVILSDFSIGRTEVTIEQYLAFCEETGKHYPEWLEPGSDYHIETGSDGYYKHIGMSRANKRHPVTGVSWNDAVAYCNWLSGKTGKKFRLPTEAEWEYAARGGQKAARQTKYAGSDNLNEVGWYTENTNDTGTRPVATKKPNALGLYDMSGNVWEWCADWYGNYEDTGKPQSNPRGPGEGILRMFRGGSWIRDGRYCRVSHRNLVEPAFRFYVVGFRLASSPQ